MFSSTDSGSPSYISSHSADVILSDIRPIKLKIDALCSINVLLDEFLYNILKASRSLTTNKLRAGLLGVLPTTLGKEALLEAEVELRAYWDRTRRPKGPSSLEDDSDSFHLQWAFELLRLKCEAYSTLNESDEDPVAESRLHERMAGVSNQQPPKPSLVAPAALYLTAILEAMCEHILSNVGRVAARDSSRTTATVQDVFTALCEDDSIYGLFKTMNVYEQIEQQSQETRPRRSKSISRTDKLSISRTSSREGVVKGSSPTPTPPSRVSSEGSFTVAPSNASGPRTSIEKAKSLKKFGRSSGDRENSSVNGHKKSDSTLSENGKQNWGVYNQYEEGDTSLQDFDDLMRSDATMKVSLTPDRLKTMEVYKQEKQGKDQRANHKRAPDGASVGSRSDSRRPSLRNVDSIQEDEEELHSRPATAANNRIRQHSVTSISSKAKAAVLSRTRSTSVGGPSIQGITRKSSKSEIGVSHPPPTMQTQNRSRAFAGGRPQGFDGDPFPPRTRKIQHNRESLDLDEVMAGSDGEEDDALTLSKAMSTPKRPPAQKVGGNVPKVSASTRELMDFLNEGPPVDSPRTGGVSKSGRELIDFLDNGPPDYSYGLPPIADTTKKGSGRLQRMMSKLSIGGEKGAKQDDFSRRLPPTTPVSPTHRGGLSPQSSVPNMSMLANRPIPPRPPQPQMISPPSSPKHSSVDLPASAPSLPPPQMQRVPVTRKTPSYDPDIPEASTPAPLVTKPIPPIATETRNVPVPTDVVEQVKSSLKPVSPRRSPARSTPPSIQTVRKVVPESSSATTPSSVISTGDLQQLRRHISRATNPEECRLVVDAFLSRAGIPIEPVECDVPYPSPSNTEAAGDNKRSSTDSALEASLVEFFLGGESAHPEPASPRKKKYRSTKNIAMPTHVKMNGHTHVIPVVPEGIKA